MLTVFIIDSHFVRHKIKMNFLYQQILPIFFADRQLHADANYALCINSMHSSSVNSSPAPHLPAACIICPKTCCGV